MLFINGMPLRRPLLYRLALQLLANAAGGRATPTNHELCHCIDGVTQYCRGGRATPANHELMTSHNAAGVDGQLLFV
jgi:hypothetical protein